MSVTRADLRVELSRRLGDSGSTIWSADELDGYIQEGYDELTQRTGCLWATDVLPDYASAFNYTSDFEADYFVGGDVVSGIAQFTASFERDYLDNARGPANHSYHWEQNLGYVTWETLVSAVDDLPTDLHEVERATWNTKRIEALSSRYFEENDGRYELNRGIVEAYTQDKDGINRFRKWRVPSEAYAPYALDTLPDGFDYTSSFESAYFTSVSGLADFTTSADAPFLTSADIGPVTHNYKWEVSNGFIAATPGTEFGILVDITDVSTADAEGDGFGDFVQIDGQHILGDEWGVIVGIYTEPNNVRLEYRKRGLELSDTQNFEIADRYTVYVRHYAQARALEREGPGQDLELSAHFGERYETGIARMLKRKQAMQFQMATVLGSGGTSPKRNGPRLARLPWNYGTVVR